MNRKGFTLVEMLIVLVIIGVILALLFPNALTATRKTNEKECASNIRTIETAMQLCYSSTRDWAQCDSVAELRAASPVYLDEDPICPFADAYNITVDADGAASVVRSEHFATWPPRGVPHL